MNSDWSWTYGPLAAVGTHCPFCNLLWVMPERGPSSRHGGMESLNSVGSTGSCDSMESISSNHSAFSGDSYDHLSAEERECLMFLEETIDSLDTEADSGLSNDESERGNKALSLPQSEPVWIPSSNGDGKTSIQIPTQPKMEEGPNNRGTAALDLDKVVLPKQGYHSFPRIVQIPRVEIPTQTSDVKLAVSSADPVKALYGKPRSLSCINQPQAEERTLSELLLLPPPDLFRDPQTVDKRRSINDPMDAHGARFEREVGKLAKTSEHKEAPPTVWHPPAKVVPPMVDSMSPRPLSPRPLSPRPLSPRPLSPQMTTHPEDPHVHVTTGENHFKQGPPTAPKPRKFPSHIIMKPSTGGGVASNIDPQQRPRTFSAHESHMGKEQEKARLEALQKLGLLQEKMDAPRRGSFKSHVFPKPVEIPVPQGVMEHGKKDAYGKSVSVTIRQQEKPDVLGTSPVQPSFLAPQKEAHSRGSDDATRNEGMVRNRLSIKSNSLEKADEHEDRAVQHSVLLVPREADAVEGGYLSSVKAEVSSSRPSVKASSQEKADEGGARTGQPPKETHVVFDDSPKNLKSDVMSSSKQIVKTSPQEKVEGRGALNPAQHAVPTVEPALLPKVDRPQENRTKGESIENISMMSTSPGKTFNVQKPREVPVPHPSPEVTLRDSRGRPIPDKSNRHSTCMDTPGEEFLHFPQGSVPGLRQINIKSNTLERSGVGLSSYISSGENQGQKSSSSIFKKPMFSANFLRNSRPRPASLGTGKDFPGIEDPTMEVEKTEKRRSFFPGFSRNARTALPVTSVKITPKGSSDEHRREALKKLGLLKE
ncbi:specifically androgen-regulated gene protein isoform X1 [Ascaphus truei]|uniref:specifically androgen-regulated gene protein isoform X1 n=2 Tax=Ascaphus truei TaxID=8439 RepID=UPI003F59552A